MRIGTRIALLLTLCLATLLMTIHLLPPLHFIGLEYDVRVINGFKTNSSLPLVIWCSSSGDNRELGGRALQEGDDFGWRLKTDFWGTTRFICTVKLDQRRCQFDAFRVPRDAIRCSSPLRKCSWLVREDAFYFSNDEINWNKDFSWS